MVLRGSPQLCAQGLYAVLDLIRLATCKASTQSYIVTQATDILVFLLLSVDIGPSSRDFGFFP